jgi:hypothetical protein
MNINYHLLFHTKFYLEDITKNIKIVKLYISQSFTELNIVRAYVYLDFLF